MEEFDRAAADYVEHLWQVDAPESHAVEFLSAVARLVPRARRGLPTTAFYVANWRRTVRRQRAQPLPQEVVQAMAGICFARDLWQLGVALLLGFVGLLRPAELLKLRVQDVVMPHRAAEPALLILLETKSGQRQNREEKAIVGDPLVVAGLSRVVGGRPRLARLFPFSAQKLVDLLRGLLREAGFPAHNVSGYSLRRGGATWFMLATGSMAATSVHGRWASERTARIYVDGAMAQQARLAMTEPTRRVVRVGARLARAFLEQERVQGRRPL